MVKYSKNLKEDNILYKRTTHKKTPNKLGVFLTNQIIYCSNFILTGTT